MSGGARRSGDGPGETGPPASRRLDRAPGDRYTRAKVSSQGADTGRPLATAVGPRFGPAIVDGGLALLGVAAVWALAAGLLDVSWGLLFVAAVGGWLIGSAVAFGAWRGLEHRQDPRTRAIAAGSGALAWLVGSYGAYLVGLLVLPGSTLNLVERMANVPFIDALATQVSLVDVASIVLLMVVAWRSAR